MKELALVTGGSAGIGLELCREFAAHGHPVALVSLVQAEIDEAIATLTRHIPGAQLHGLALDLTAPQAALKVLEWTQREGLQVDILCNNAGIGLFGDFLSEPLALRDKLIDLNIKASVDLVQAFLPGMRERRSGRIMMMSSVTILQATPPHCTYGASKAFVDHFSRSLYYGERHLKTGVSVTSVIPAAVRNTQFQRTQGVDMQTFRTGLVTTTPQEVARDAYAGVMAGKKRVFTGRRERILRALGFQSLPEGWLMPLVFKELSPVKKG